MPHIPKECNCKTFAESGYKWHAVDCAYRKYYLDEVRKDETQHERPYKRHSITEDWIRK